MPADRDAMRLSLKLLDALSMRGVRARVKPSWYVGVDASCSSRGVVVGGCPRSGTTLVRDLLDAHPAMCCGPESGLFCGRFDERRLAERFGMPRARIRELESSASHFPKFVGALLDEYARRRGVSVWAEKTPKNVLNVGWILDRFPEVIFCHVVRDGRAVVASLLEMSGRERAPRHLRFGSETEAALFWSRMVAGGLEHSGHPRVVTVRYEDLVTSPRETMSPVLQAVGLEWSAEMTRHHETPSAREAQFRAANPTLEPVHVRSLDLWREQLSASQVQAIEDAARPELVALEYL